MTDQTTTPATEPQPDDQLIRFRAWSVNCGHYPVTEAVDRYLLLQQTNKAAIDAMVDQANG